MQPFLSLTCLIRVCMLSTSFFSSCVSVAFHSSSTYCLNFFTSVAFLFSTPRFQISTQILSIGFRSGEGGTYPNNQFRWQLESNPAPIVMHASDRCLVGATTEYASTISLLIVINSYSIFSSSTPPYPKFPSHICICICPTGHAD